MTRDVGEPTPWIDCAKHWALPKLPLDTSAVTQSKLGWFSKFCACALNFTLTLSVSLNVLCRLASNCWKRGPWKTPLPRLPKRSYRGPLEGYPGFTKSEFGVETPKFALHASVAEFGPTDDSCPGKPQPIGLLSLKIPSAGLPPL